MSHKSSTSQNKGKKELVGVDAQVKQLEDELAKTKYNKATQFHIGLVKAKIAMIKEKAETRAKSRAPGEGYSVKKSGDATAVLVGFPSVGKSTLLNRLTNAESKTAAYDFTTLTCIPGMMEYNNTKIQILDIPGIIRGASSGSGRGKEVIAVARGADVIIAMVNALELWQLDAIKKELHDAGIRINEKKPNMRIKTTSKGGVSIGSTVPLTVDKNVFVGILREYKLINCDVVIHEDITIDRFIDALEGNKEYKPCVIALNKVDLLDEQSIKEIQKQVSVYGECIPISADRNYNLDKLREVIFKKLEFIRIYMKELSKKPDMGDPVIIRKSSTVRDVCSKIHTDFIRRFRFCRVWGKSAKFPGQRFNLEHVMQDGDVLELHLK